MITSKPKIPTIKFYTKGRYMGWIKLRSYREQVLQLQNWVRSGNDLKIGNTLINDPDYITPDLFPTTI